MTKYTSKLTVNILTFRTEKKILNDCINSISKSIPINIIENSKNFHHEMYFKKKEKILIFFVQVIIQDMEKVTTMVFLKLKVDMF